MSLSRIRGGDPPIKTYITSLHQSFPHTRGGTTCLSAAQCARKHLGAPSLLKVESTVCFQRKRGLTSSKHEVSNTKCVFPACAGVIPSVFPAFRRRDRLSRMCGGDPAFIPDVSLNGGSFPHTRGGTTCLSAAQCARKHFGTPSLLKVESTLCFQRKRGLTLSKHEVSSAKLGLSRMCGGDPCFLNATILIHLVFPALRGGDPVAWNDKNIVDLSFSHARG